MNNQPIEQTAQNEQPQVETTATPRAWVKPTFERLTLKEAMTGGNSPNTDAHNYAS